MEKIITARGHKVSSRAEAWAAWEAALVEKASIVWPPRKHLVRWEKFFRGPAKWWLVAVDTRPNSGMVLVEKLSSATLEWVPILRPYGMRNAVWETYKVSQSFPEIRERQRVAVERNDLTWSVLSGQREVLPGVVSRREITRRSIQIVTEDGLCFTQFCHSATLWMLELGDESHLYAEKKEDLYRYFSQHRVPE